MRTRRERWDAAGPRTVERFRWFFVVAALYDGLLGLGFFLLYRPIFDALGIPRPPNSSYVLLTAGFIAVQGLGYFLVSRDMLRNVDIVKMGVVYKLVYTSLAVYYLVTGQLLHAIFAWLGACDALFLIGFLVFLYRVQSSTEQEPTGARRVARP